MNKDEAFRRFTKENFNFLTGLDLNKKSLKAVVRKFFVDQHNKRYGQPSITNICEYLVRYQTKNGVPRITILDQIDVLPVFKGVESEKLKTFVNEDHSSVLTEDEIGRIEKTSAYESIRSLEGERFKEEIQEENKDLLVYVVKPSWTKLALI
jgi:hypothetical protein